jgi:hypothetical protein
MKFGSKAMMHSTNLIAIINIDLHDEQAINKWNFGLCNPKPGSVLAYVFSFRISDNLGIQFGQFFLHFESSRIWLSIFALSSRFISNFVVL